MSRSSAPVTVPTDQPVEAFLATAEPPRRRVEGEQVVDLFTQVTGIDPVMWGPSMIGWGEREYHYPTGRSGIWPPLAFSPRKAQLTFYGFREVPACAPLLEQLGPHTASVGCVYVKRLELVDLDVLAALARTAYAYDPDQG